MWILITVILNASGPEINAPVYLKPILHDTIEQCELNLDRIHADLIKLTYNYPVNIKLEYDEKVISYEKIIKIFFEIHDPTTLNAQGPDIGTQYRSEIFFLNDNQKQIAEKVLKDFNERLSGKIVTKISLLKNYCPAEEYHQKYLEKR